MVPAQRLGAKENLVSSPDSLWIQEKESSDGHVRVLRMLE